MIVVVGSKYYAKPIWHIADVTSDTKRLFKSPEKVSLVMFTGGEDIHPYFYEGVDPNNLCMTCFGRDRAEKEIFEFCTKHSIKMTGICRGIQFLNVMAGGFMYQHITNHAGVLHGTYFPYDSTVREVTSTHHQLVGLPNSSIPIAWSHPKRSDIYIGPFGNKKESPEYEIEAAIFPNINAMGVQYHPELLGRKDPCRIHYGQMIEDFVEMSTKEFINKYDGRIAHGRGREAGDSRR